LGGSRPQDGSVDGNTGFLILLVVSRYLLVTDSYPGHPALDVAVSHAVLGAVARGEMEGVFRLHVPGSVVVFGAMDRVQPGYAQAVHAALANGFGAVERLAGGRAAVFHEQTLAFSWVTPEPEPRSGIRERFETVANVMVEAFERLGIDARIGELPGEYCPGRWSVNVGGRVKVMGVGQRLVRGAAHVGGVVVVDDGERIRDVLIPVYRALQLDWDPRTTGALADRAPGLDNTKVSNSIIATMGKRFELVPGELPSSVVAEAQGLLPEHLPRVA
jgi:octanoyl-[GcvH]:protein N-octanoyltransferase